MKKRLRLLIILAGVLAIIFGSLFLYVKTRPPVYIDSDILKKLNFFVYYPVDGDKKVSGWHADKPSTSYDEQTGVLHQVVIKGNTRIEYNQQMEPDAFKDIPQQYSRMINLMRPYTEVSTSLGTITLTKPGELSGGQTAVADVRGTLMFAKPSKDLGGSEWAEFFNSLALIK